MNQAQMEQFNIQLVALFPALRERLRERYGAELDAWLERGESKAVFIRKTLDSWCGLFELDTDLLQEYASETYCLDMEGWDGFCPANPITPEGLQRLQEEFLKHVEILIAPEMQKGGLRRLAREVAGGYYDNRLEDKQDAAFFIYGAIIHDGQSERLADLWILEQSPDHHDYIFLLEEGASLSAAWRLCAELLPPEVAAVLELEYLELEERDAT